MDTSKSILETLGFSELRISCFGLGRPLLRMLQPGSCLLRSMCYSIEAMPLTIRGCVEGRIRGEQIDLGWLCNADIPVSSLGYTGFT